MDQQVLAREPVERRYGRRLHPRRRGGRLLGRHLQVRPDGRLRLRLHIRLRRDGGREAGRGEGREVRARRRHESLYGGHGPGPSAGYLGNVPRGHHLHARGPAVRRRREQTEHVRQERTRRGDDRADQARRQPAERKNGPRLLRGGRHGRHERRRHARLVLQRREQVVGSAHGHEPRLRLRPRRPAELPGVSGAGAPPPALRRRDDAPHGPHDAGRHAGERKVPRLPADELHGRRDVPRGGGRGRLHRLYGRRLLPYARLLRAADPSVGPRLRGELHGGPLRVRRRDGRLPRDAAADGAPRRRRRPPRVRLRQHRPAPVGLRRRQHGRLLRALPRPQPAARPHRGHGRRPDCGGRRDLRGLRQQPAQHLLLEQRLDGLAGSVRDAGLAGRRRLYALRPAEVSVDDGRARGRCRRRRHPQPRGIARRQHDEPAAHPHGPDAAVDDGLHRPQPGELRRAVLHEGQGPRPLLELLAGHAPDEGRRRQGLPLHLRGERGLRHGRRLDRRQRRADPDGDAAFRCAEIRGSRPPSGDLVPGREVGRHFPHRQLPPPELAVLRRVPPVHRRGLDQARGARPRADDP